MNDAGFKISKNDSYEFVDYKKSASEVLYNIASFGGTATAGKLMNRTELRKFCDLYESKHRTSKGIPLTYKAIQGIAYCSGPGKHND